MPQTSTLTKETVHRAAPDAGALQNARDLVRKNSFTGLGVSPDGVWLMAQCKGSGQRPYEVSVDLTNDAAPVSRCTCPSRKFPCKHGLGLMLAFVATPEAFTECAPPADLVAKHEKQVERAQKKAAGEGSPRKVNKAALARKATAQREGLDLLEKLLIDLVAGGQWFEASRLERLERQSKQMADAYLPGTMVALHRLVLLGRQRGLAEEERNATAADLIGQLWATVQKGRNYLENKLEAGEAQSEADAVMEEVFGTAWQLADLKDRGYVRQNLSLLELAYERFDDEALESRIEISHLVELTDGALYQAITYRPFKAMKQIAEQPSYLSPLAVAEVAVYPGFLNRRIRWDKGADRTLPLEAAHLQAAYAQAAPAFDVPLAAFRKQLKHPLAPREAVVLLRCRTLGRIGSRVVVEDARGSRIEALDRQNHSTNVANLVRAAGELQLQPALLARLFVQPLTGTIVAEPLALLTPEKHLRLGV
jgi:SWIM zinc finger